MISKSVLEMTNLSSWQERFFKINRVLKLSCVGYVLIIVLLLAALLIAGLSIKEDITVTIRQFSISAPPSEAGTDYPLFFEGVVPYDLKKIHKSEDIHFAKLYFISSEEEHIGQRKILISLKDVKIINADEFTHANSSETAIHKTHLLVPMKMGILKADMSRISADGADIITILNDMENRDVGDGIEKVKIVLGETTILEFWLNKMFSRSPLFKEMNEIVD